MVLLAARCISSVLQFGHGHRPVEKANKSPTPGSRCKDSIPEVLELVKEAPPAPGKTTGSVPRSRPGPATTAIGSARRRARRERLAASRCRSARFPVRQRTAGSCDGPGRAAVGEHSWLISSTRQRGTDPPRRSSRSASKWGAGGLVAEVGRIFNPSAQKPGRIENPSYRARVSSSAGQAQEEQAEQALAPRRAPPLAPRAEPGLGVPDRQWS